MVKVLIINSYIHEKNRIGFLSILNHLQIEYKVGTPADIPNYDVIYSPSQPINPAITKVSPNQNPIPKNFLLCTI